MVNYGKLWQTMVNYVYVYVSMYLSIYLTVFLSFFLSIDRSIYLPGTVSTYGAPHTLQAPAAGNNCFGRCFWLLWRLSTIRIFT